MVRTPVKASSRLLPETFLGNPVYVQYLGFFMNQSTWFADRYGNRLEVPGVGERFWLVDLYYDAGGSLMGEQNYLFAILVFAGTLAVSGLGLLIYQRISRHRKE